MRLLVVEDDPDLGRQLKTALTEAGYAVDLAVDGEDGHFSEKQSLMMLSFWIWGYQKWMAFVF